MRCELKDLPISIEQAEHIMASTFTLAAASKSKRRATAALLVHLNNGYPMILSSGVNGTRPGESNIMETSDLTLSLPSVIHAEVNCINRLDQYSLWPEPEDILFCTDSPCPDCLHEIESVGITTIIYAREYRLTDHLDASQVKMFCLDLNSVEARMVRGIERMKEVIATTPSV